MKEKAILQDMTEVEKKRFQNVMQPQVPNVKLKLSAKKIQY